ncbi:MAG: hypothetical protein LQ349_005824 [Xanthoria aureola]|nr:MAG: hypothetical protein LQ349_005824 [Xanthoria aureola]
MYISHPWFTILYLLFFRLVRSSPAQPITRPLPLLLPSGHVNFSLANSGLGYGPIPDGFSLRPDMQFPRPMSESATLINIAHAIKQLGQGDIQGEVLPRDFATARYPEPVIAVRVPPSRRTLKRQYVISALILAMMHMLSLDQPTLRWSHYTLLWHGEEIGGLAFGIYSPPALLEGMAQNATSAQKRAEPQVNSDIISQQESNQAVATTTTGVTNNRLSVAITYLGPGLEKTDLLSTLILVMAQAAVPASETRFANWVPEWLEGHTRFLASAAARRTSPPYMTYYWLLEALVQTADYLVDRDRYGDVRMLVSVDGAQIGQGLLRHR